MTTGSVTMGMELFEPCTIASYLVVRICLFSNEESLDKLYELDGLKKKHPCMNLDSLADSHKHRELSNAMVKATRSEASDLDSSVKSVSYCISFILLKSSN